MPSAVGALLLRGNFPLGSIWGPVAIHVFSTHVIEFHIYIGAVFDLVKVAPEAFNFSCKFRAAVSEDWLRDSAELKVFLP